MTARPLLPTRLRCAHTVNPLGVAPDRVRLSWALDGPGADRGQKAFRILVGCSEADLARDHGSCWDSGRVESTSPTDIAYAGQPLRPAGRYQWKVRVWDETGAPSPWSEPAWFEVELDPARDWHASWIGGHPEPGPVTPPSGDGPVDAVTRAMTPPRYLRRSFQVADSVAAARLHITARGLYAARLNGTPVTAAVLTPGWTDYAQRVAYQTYDVTALLTRGENVLGVLLGDGWYSGFFGYDPKRAGAHYGTAPELLAQLVITRPDGTQQHIGTDGSWRVGSGAIRHADLLMGERQDLRREPGGWDRPGFDASDWSPVTARPRDAARLVADPGPPIRVTQELPPRSITRAPAGELIVDFGQNLAGWVRLSVTGPPGREIRIRHGEVLDAAGALYTDNLRMARQADEFVTAGGREILEPHFTLHGFRYAEISGHPGPLDPSHIRACVVHSDTPPTGSFECSEPWLNQLFGTIDWGQRGNFVSVPTDCPQRDERLGWLGDAQIFARTACYNRDVASFFAKWMDDVADAQLPSGSFTDVAPRLGTGHFTQPGAPAWGDAGVIVPWTMYQVYGDRGILERHYSAMTAWMRHLRRDNPGLLRTRGLGHNYGDWLAPHGDHTPRELLATAYWAYDTALMAEIAGALGRSAEAAEYRALGTGIRSAFAEAFVAADGRLASDTQTAYVLGLHMRVIPEPLRPNAAAHLVAAIRRENWMLSTGFAGVGYMLPVLSSNGYSAVAYRLLSQDALPSWRYMLDHGATTIWERWDGWTPERGFQSPYMNSFNHYALGSVGEWIYRFVLGIDLEPGRAGFERLLIRPHPGGSLRAARGGYMSVRGLITTSWQCRGHEFALRVEIPPNVTASVRVPSADPAEVRDAGGARPSGTAGFPGAAGAQEAVFEVGSGAHEFTGPVMREQIVT